MSLVTEQHSMRNPRAVLHWHDFLCPWRIDILTDFGGNRAGELRRAMVAECTR